MKQEFKHCFVLQWWSQKRFIYFVIVKLGTNYEQENLLINCFCHMKQVLYGILWKECQAGLQAAAHLCTFWRTSRSQKKENGNVHCLLKNSAPLETCHSREGTLSFVEGYKVSPWNAMLGDNMHLSQQFETKPPCIYRNVHRT